MLHLTHYVPKARVFQCSASHVLQITALGSQALQHIQGFSNHRELF